MGWVNRREGGRSNIVEGPEIRPGKKLTSPEYHWFTSRTMTSLRSTMPVAKTRGMSNGLSGFLRQFSILRMDGRGNRAQKNADGYHRRGGVPSAGNSLFAPS